MNKHIFIVNGMARAGKDTFAEMLGDMIHTWKYSSIDKVKMVARHCGWDGGKTETDRKFLSDLKCLLTGYNDLPFKSILETVNIFYKHPLYQVFLIDIREPAEIERAKVAFNAKTIFIENNRVTQVTSNMADAGVYNYKYDYIIENNGTLDEFRENIEEFARKVGLITDGCAQES